MTLMQHGFLDLKCLWCECILADMLCALVLDVGCSICVIELCVLLWCQAASDVLSTLWDVLKEAACASDSRLVRMYYSAVHRSDLALWLAYFCNDLQLYILTCIVNLPRDGCTPLLAGPLCFVCRLVFCSPCGWACSNHTWVNWGNGCG